MQVGTVIAAAPLRIRRDGDSVNVPAVATDSALHGGDRVLTENVDNIVYVVAVLGGAARSLLESTAYAPPAVAVVAASAGYTSVDAANLLLTFVAPPSGRVLVELAAFVAVTSTGLAYWALHDAAAGGALVDEAAVSAAAAANVNIYARVYVGPVAGLTPGEPYTWWWRHKEGTADIETVFGGVYGPAVMRVWAH